jgi:glycosyltransferase involved in cell wall biosynthesis
MQRELIARGLNVPVDAVSNGVDTDLFQPRNDHQQLITNQITLLHVGRLGYEKRVDDVVRAFSYLASDHPHVRLLIVGDGPESNALKTLADTLGVADQVQFKGFITHDRLPEIYRQADLFVTASMIETQGLVVLEAMASGLPIVGVAAMALPDLIQHGINGYLVKPGNEKALASGMTQLIQSAELRLAMGRESRRLALQHSLPEVAQEYEGQYQQIIAQAPQPLLSFLPKMLNPDVIWAALFDEGQALKDAGAEWVWEISKALRRWTWKTFAPVVDQVRNGLPGRRW